MTAPIDDRTEWLEADGLGGFASGTASGIRTRRYHALLLAATTPPTGRMVLVNGFDAWIDTPGGSFALTTQRYAPDVLHPDGASRIVSFEIDPWPAWTFELPGGHRILQELFVEHGTGVCVVTWRSAGPGPLTLRVRPFLSGRDYHALHHANPAFRFEPSIDGRTVTFTPYDGVPSIDFDGNGAYRHAPDWYRQFFYRDEHERGLDDVEDLGSPGEFTWTLDVDREAVLMVRARLRSTEQPASVPDADAIRERERARRAAFTTPLARAADAYVVRRGHGRTIIAGYPWFTDWGRDTFIALRGLCLATGRFADARDILVEWADALSEGMLPNRFTDRGETPEFNAVDASLWYVVAVHELLRDGGDSVTTRQRRILEHACDGIVAGYAAGTRFGIRLDADGLIAAGAAGVALTWMDARVGSRVVTPRIGKPVEIQALWLNALSLAAVRDPQWREPLKRGRASFLERFWNEERGWLADVVDADHVPGSVDATFRPNQILAVGGLPMALVRGAQARRIVDAVEARLLTPIGLRSLAPGEPGYCGTYCGCASDRDGSYHQGTVWPWLMGPFVDAWLRVRRNTDAAKHQARERFVEPLLAHAREAGLAHVSEIADAEPPFTPRGCPFQAWSLGELLRIDRLTRETQAGGVEP